MWSFIYHSEPGSSHVKDGRPCQDSSLATRVSTGDEDVLIAACSDGAGSATFSSMGAELSCGRMIERIAQALQGGLAPNSIDGSTFAEWFIAVHHELLAKADELSVTPRELACTLLVVVASPHTTACAQLGDGAIVIPDKESHNVVFWPDNGEYANTTYFLTDPAFEGHLMSRALGAVDAIAMMTDGLQRLALDFQTQLPHEPFFVPLFNALRTTSSAEDLTLPLRQFLSSPGVNERTDDDKTLLLAVRRVDGVA
jgi:protein phosphatase 2C-like protein